MRRHSGGQSFGQDPARYIAYYRNQANQIGGLQGFSGTNVMYGAGLGGLFRGMYRIIAPLFKTGLNLAKPHLTSAAKSIVGDVVRHIATRPNRASGTQEGSGLMVMTKGRGVKKRPPGVRSVRRGKKNRGRNLGRPVSKRKPKRKQRRAGSLSSSSSLGFKGIF